MPSLIDFSEDDDMHMIDEPVEERSAEDEKRVSEDSARKEMMLEVKPLLLCTVIYGVLTFAESRDIAYAITARILQNPDEPNHKSLCTATNPEAQISVTRLAGLIVLAQIFIYSKSR